MDRDAALALLRRNHQFPGIFEFRVVTTRASVAATLSAMTASSGEGGELKNLVERPSAKGNYVALRVQLHLEDAERVLDIYEVLRTVDGVVTAM